MKDLNLSIREVADRARISPEYLTNLIKGRKSNPSANVLAKLADALSCDIADIRNATGTEQAQRGGNFLLGISGPSCAGKTWLADKISAERRDDVTVLDLDGFYRELEQVNRLEFTHDNPEAIRFDEVLVAVTTLASGQEARVPIYDFETHSRIGERTCIPKRIIVLEGLFLFANPTLLRQLDLRIWIEAGEARRMIRRVSRDMKLRQRSIDEVAERYMRDVVPAYEKYLEPLRCHADMIIANDTDNPRLLPKVVPMILAYIDQVMRG